MLSLSLPLNALSLSLCLPEWAPLGVRRVRELVDSVLELLVYEALSY